jgi:hypothetical protein
MKTRILIIFTLFNLFKVDSYAQTGGNSLNINGYARNYTGVLLNEGNSLSILQNTLNLDFTHRGDKIAFKVNPYMDHYFDHTLEWGLREAYLDMYFDNFDLRLGKQQIIWGKAEGVFITDVVSPKDLSEFLLRDFDEIRMGVTSLKLNYYFGSSTLEAVWVPVFTPTLMPGEGSIWRPDMNFPAPPTFDFSTSTVKPTLDNSELFLRYSTMTPKFDMELVGGTFYYDDPALHLTKTIDTSTMQLAGLLVRPEYHRVNMAGGSVGLPLGPLVLRAEGAFYSGRYFQTQDPAYAESVLKKDNLHYMAGLDFNLAGIIMSAQFIQEYIIEHEAGMQKEKFENTMTFLARKDFLREKMWLELFSYVGLTNKDALIRPKITYAFADGFEVLGGANIFLGDSGNFGQFSDNNMVYMKLKYSF